MAIAVRGTPQIGAATNGGNVTLTFSTGAGAPLEGDVVVVFGGHGVNVTTLAAPGSGYTQIGIHTGTAPIFGAWYKVMAATPDLSVVCSGGGHVDDGVAYCCWVFSGVDSVVLDQTTVTAGPTTSTNPDCASITTQTANAWVLAMAGSAVNDAAITGPSGYSNHITNNGNDVADLTAAGATLAVVSPAATNPPSWTGWASGAWYGITAALKANTAVSVALTAAANATGSAGALTASVSTALTGYEGTGAIGTLTSSASYNVPLVGNEGAGSAGSLAASISTALTGYGGTGATESFSVSVVTSLFGYGAVGTAGIFTPSGGVPVSGGGYFGHRYFGAHFFAPRFFSPAGGGGGGGTIFSGITRATPYIQTITLQSSDKISGNSISYSQEGTP